MANKIVTTVNKNSGTITVRTHIEGILSSVLLCETYTAQVREGLIKLGWTPPDEKINKN